jgi:hypothetical protein
VFYGYSTVTKKVVGVFVRFRAPLQVQHCDILREATPEDTALVHGISHTEVFNSVWCVVDACNCLQAEGLQFSFQNACRNEAITK